MLLTLFTLAFAQAPIALGSASEAPVVYVVAPEGVAVKRFFDDAEPGDKTLPNGAALTVLFREGGWVRVRQGDIYGWIPESTVSDQAPTAPSE